MHFPQGCRDDLDLWMMFDNAVDHSEKCARIELGFRGNLRTRNPETHLEVFLISQKNVHVLDDAANHLYRFLMATKNVPKFGAIVQIERNNSSRSFSCLHTFDHHLRSGV